MLNLYPVSIYPLLAGAVQTNSTLVPFIVNETGVIYEGTVEALAEIDEEYGPSPKMFTAVILNRYVFPVVKEMIVSPLREAASLR